MAALEGLVVDMAVFYGGYGWVWSWLLWWICYAWLSAASATVDTADSTVQVWVGYPYYGWQGWVTTPAITVDSADSALGSWIWVRGFGSWIRVRRIWFFGFPGFRELHRSRVWFQQRLPERFPGNRPSHRFIPTAPNHAVSRTPGTSRTTPGNRASIGGFNNAGTRTNVATNRTNVGGAGNRTNFASSVGQRGVMSPASSHAYANPFHGQANPSVASRGIGGAGSVSRTSFNGVQQSSVSHSVARPNFASTGRRLERREPSGRAGGVNAANRHVGGGLRRSPGRWR